MRVPTVLTKCKVTAGVAVTLMVAGTAYGSPAVRAWAILFGILAAALCISSAVKDAAELIKVYVKRWSHETFENGFHAGVEQGRAMEAAQAFIAATRDRD